MKKPKSPVLAVDGMILEKDKILMVKRAIYPFKGYWTLPGGHVEYGEQVETAIKREIKEELGISVKIKKLLGVYSDPKRDPRYHTVGVLYLLEKQRGKLKIDWESFECKYFSLNNLPKKIGFDHKRMIRDFKKYN